MRLIKLAMLALFGYAMYEFFRGMLHDTQLGAKAGDALGQLAGGRQGQGMRQPALGVGDQNISGPGEGMPEATLERDGGSVRHKVGRGVIS